jgi:RNA polymerase primary sigma factor
MQRAIADQGRTIRLPHHISQKVDRLRRAAGDGFERAGAPASPDDLAEHAGLPPGEAPRLLLLAGGAISLHAPARSGDTALEDFLADKAAIEPLDAALQSEIVDGVRDALTRLEPREARVLRLRYGIGTGAEHTTGDVARQLGLSRERVRQIQLDALAHLREQAQMLEALLDDARHSADACAASGADPCQRVEGKRRHVILAAPAEWHTAAPTASRTEANEHADHRLAARAPQGAERVAPTVA